MRTVEKSKLRVVSSPSLASLEEYLSLLRTPWESGVLTHNGPLVQRLEAELREYLPVRNIVTLVNGTIALQLAIKALDIKGEVITTPFSWVATASAIRWEQCTPVFVDIDPHTLNIDPAKIERAITHRTTAIMAVHVFSNPCDTEAIADIARRRNLKVIYDAAHAVGVRYQGRSVLEHGDVSATSFHATKIFNTGEGGACITLDDDLHQRLQRLRFFGYDAAKEVVEDGTNGKMTEIHAALGLANLPYLDQVIARRRDIFGLYHQGLKDMPAIRFQQFDPAAYNFSYMPVIFDTEQQLLAVEKDLVAHQILPRRYFYPSLNTLPAVAPYQPMPVSESIADRILCLPSNNQLTDEDVFEVVDRIRTVLS
ncbi:MAG: dTDP-4-amino-4,6-dideoxy-D-glucose transaminase [Bacteroidota bacterium]|jgi:dTDP-4-amino-4,6-dideoxygalactose transaminase